MAVVQSALFWAKCTRNAWTQSGQHFIFIRSQLLLWPFSPVSNLRLWQASSGLPRVAWRNRTAGWNKGWRGHQRSISRGQISYYLPHAPQQCEAKVRQAYTHSWMRESKASQRQMASLWSGVSSLSQRWPLTFMSQRQWPNVCHKGWPTISGTSKWHRNENSS